MNDAIRTNTFTSNQQVSSTQAAAYEQQLEADVLNRVNEKALADVVLKQLSGNSISSADAQALMDSCNGLTARDIDALVAAGKLNRQEGDTLLLASTLGAYNEGKTTAPDVAAAMNKFYSMSQADQEATLNTFANQGSYERNMALVFNEDGSLASSTYQLSVGGEDLGPGDLPSTPDIQRAALFLMSSKTDATKLGAIQAFTNWEFQTATDQMSAMLSSLPSYENLTDTQLEALSKYLTAAGRVAAGNPNAAAVSEKRAEQIESREERIANQKADLIAALNELKLQQDSLVELDKVTIILSNGEEVNLAEFCGTHNIPVPNADGDDAYNRKELQAVIDNMQGHVSFLDHKKELLDLELNGADAETIDKMRKNFQEQRETEMVKEVLRAWQYDTSAGDNGKDPKFHVDKAPFWVMSPYDKDGKPWPDGKSHQIEYNVMEWFAEHQLAFSDKGNTAGMSWDHMDNDYLLGEDEVDFVIKGMSDHLADLNNNATMIRAEHKADWPGGQELIDQMQTIADDQADWEACLQALTMANQDNHFRGVSAGKTKFTDHNGNVVSCSEYMRGHGIDYAHHDGNTFMDQDDFEKLRDETIPGKIDNLKSEGAEIAQKLEDLPPPPPPSGPRAPGGDSAPPRRAAGGDSAPPRRVAVPNQAEIERLMKMAAEDRTEAEKQFLVEQLLKMAAEDMTEAEKQFLVKQLMKMDAEDMTEVEKQFLIEQLMNMDVEDMTEAEKKFLIEETKEDIKNQPDYDPDGSYDYDTAVKDVKKDWSADQKRDFDKALDTTTERLNNGEVMGPDDLMAEFGLTDAQCIDIGMLMFIIMSDRLQLLGDQIQNIIKQQRKNTNDQADMNNALAALNTAGDKVDLKETTFTLSDGSTSTLADYFDTHGVKYDNDDGDYILGKEEIQTCVANIKGSANGLANEGQSILNELTQLTQKYQQAESLMMNFLEKFDAMKQKIIDKIRAN